MMEECARSVVTWRRNEIRWNSLSRTNSYHQRIERGWNETLFLRLSLVLFGLFFGYGS